MDNYDGEVEQQVEYEIPETTESIPTHTRPTMYRRSNRQFGGSHNSQIVRASRGGKGPKKEDNMPKDNPAQNQNGKQQGKGEKPKEGKDNKQVADEKPTTPPDENDVGKNRLGKSLANKGRNLFGLRKGKKKKEEKKDSNDNENKKDESNNNDSEDKEDEEKKSSGLFNFHLSKFAKIKIMIIGSVVLFSFIFFILVILALLGFDVTQAIPTFSATSYNTEGFVSVYEEGTEEYNLEINYYKKLEEVSEKFEKEHGESLKTNYIHSFLIYIYYLLDAKDINADGSDRIDYNALSSKVDDVVKLMTPSSNNKNVDYEVNGEFYRNLKNSDLFKTYYQKVLKTEDDDEILKSIFDVALELEDMESVEATTVTTETNVSTTTTNTSMPIKEYLANSIYAKTDQYLSSETTKAYTIVFSTNLVAQNKNLTVNVNNASASNEVCSITKGCSYNDNNQLVDGGGKHSSKNTIYYNGAYYYRKPLSSSEQSGLNSTINSVFGNVLVKSDGTYPILDASKIAGFGDGDYKSIIKTTFGDFNYKNIGEDSYVDGSYGNQKVLTNVIFYDQKDYPTAVFCGIRGLTIGGSGCGVTAMAIVASTYENNRKYTPPILNEDARKLGMCGSSGTSQGFFGKEAAKFKYKYVGGTKWNKSLLNQVLKHLSEGHLVVVRIGPGHFTSGGHYMVLGGIDPETKKVYVYDPNNRANKSYRKTGNGWYSFNDIIVKEAYNFYIIWKG